MIAFRARALQLNHAFKSKKTPAEASVSCGAQEGTRTPTP